MKARIAKIIQLFKEIIKKLKEIKNPFDQRDAHIYGGLLMMFIGLWQFAPWIALSVAGLILYVTGIFARKLR